MILKDIKLGLYSSLICSIIVAFLGATIYAAITIILVITTTLCTHDWLQHRKEQQK